MTASFISTVLLGAQEHWAILQRHEGEQPSNTDSDSLVCIASIGDGVLRDGRWGCQSLLNLVLSKRSPSYGHFSSGHDWQAEVIYVMQFSLDRRTKHAIAIYFNGALAIFEEVVTRRWILAMCLLVLTIRWTLMWNIWEADYYLHPHVCLIMLTSASAHSKSSIISSAIKISKIQIVSKVNRLALPHSTSTSSKDGDTAMHVCTFLEVLEDARYSSWGLISRHQHWAHRKACCFC